MKLKRENRIKNHWNYLTIVKRKIDEGEKIKLTECTKEARVSGNCNVVAMKLGLFSKKCRPNGSPMRGAFEWNEKIPITLTLAETLMNEVTEYREAQEKARKEKKMVSDAPMFEGEAHYPLEKERKGEETDILKTEKAFKVPSEDVLPKHPEIGMEDVFDYGKMKLEDAIHKPKDPVIVGYESMLDTYLQKAMDMIPRMQPKQEVKEPVVIEEVNFLWGLYKRVKKQIK